MSRGKKTDGKPTYLQRISAVNRTQEEVAEIEKLFKQNENLAYNIAKKYYKTGYWEFDDSVQIARMGLWKACLIWDPGKFKLSTLATNVITRDFIDYDAKQKRQPGILFNLEENCVTDDLTLGDVLIDENSAADDIVEGDDTVSYINEQIIWLFEDIAYELNLPVSQVKLVYLIYMESTQYTTTSMRQIKFLPKATVNTILSMFKERLADIIKED